MAFELAAVTAYIAGLNIPGKNGAGTLKTVTINDWADFREEVDVSQCPVFQPDVTAQVTLESAARDSFGGMGTAKQTLIYTVPYVLLIEPAVGARAYYEVFPNLVFTLSRIVLELLTNDTPSDSVVDLQIASITFGQTVNDQNGNPFHGATVAVRVREFV